MSDLAVLPGQLGFDLVLGPDDLTKDEGLRSSVIMSLFTNRRVDKADLPNGAQNVQGYWGDALDEVGRSGSRLWLLYYMKRDNEMLARAREYTLEALNWLIEDKVARSIDVEAEFISYDMIGIGIKIFRPQGEAEFRFSYNWSVELDSGVQ